MGIFASDRLADIWNQVLPDIHTVIATFTPPEPKTFAFDYRTESDRDVITRNYSIFYPGVTIEIDCVPKGSRSTVTIHFGRWISRVDTCQPEMRYSGVIDSFGTPYAELELRLSNVDTLKFHLTEILGPRSQ